MARILLAWELGAGHGHTDALAPLALELRHRGHEVVFALKDLFQAERLLGAHRFRWLQAPVFSRVAVRGPLAGNHAEALFRVGYYERDTLVALTEAWRALIELVAPDALVQMFAPTAGLAARSLGVARLACGTGFHQPPASSPLPPLPPAEEAPPERLRQAEARLLDNVNAALRRSGGTPLEHAGQLFDCEGLVLTTERELDPFAELRRSARYVGPRLVWRTEHRPPWPGASDGSAPPRVFAYVKPEAPETAPLLAALARLRWPTVAYVPRMPADALAHFESTCVRIEQRPVSLEHVAERAQLAICHGNHGTTAGLLRLGVPLLLVPSQVEQMATARRLEQQGLARVVWSRPGRPPAFETLLRGLRGDGALRQRLAGRSDGRGHGAAEAGATDAAVADALESVLGG